VIVIGAITADVTARIGDGPLLAESGISGSVPAVTDANHRILTRAMVAIEWDPRLSR